MNMPELLQFIASYVNGYVVVNETETEVTDAYIKGWNDGVSTAANLVLCDDDNYPLVKAIQSYVADKIDAQARRISDLAFRYRQAGMEQVADDIIDSYYLTENPNDKSADKS